MNRLVIIGIWMAMACIHRSLLAQPAASTNSPKMRFEKRIAHLAHTMHMFCGPDGGLVGFALHLKNLSQTDSIKLRRKEDGNVPIEVVILDKEQKQVTRRTTAPMPDEKSGEGGVKINWTLGPGESRWFFLPARSLFNPLPVWERMEGCKVMMAVHGIDPPEELLAIARKWKPHGDAEDMRLNLPGIHEPFASSYFNHVLITRSSLQEKAYTEARREFEKRNP